MKSFLIFSLALMSFSSFAGIKGYSCVGTEPFFSIDIKGNVLKYSDPVTEKGETIKVVGPLSAAGVGAGHVSVYTSKYTQTTIISGDCSDGMSDNTYAYHMVYTNGSKILYGCCEPLAQH